MVWQPNGGHAWRQSSTIAMSLAFAVEAQHRGITALDFLIYPRILDRGVTNGIAICEFPLLNVLTGPFFMFLSPQTAAFVSSFLVLLMNIWTAFRFLPRYFRAWGCDLSPQIVLLMWFGFFRLGEQSVIFMPEGLAFPLTLIGIVYLLENNPLKSAWWVGVLVAGLGLSVKPTMVVVLAAGATAPLFQKEQWKHVVGMWGGCILALVFPAWWYGIHAGQLGIMSDAPQYYAPATFHPLARLEEIGWWDGLRLAFEETNAGSFPIYTGLFFVVAALSCWEIGLLGLYILALVLCMALDGRHIIVHRYYFLGLNAISLVIAAKVLSKPGMRSGFQTFFICLLVGGMLFNMRTNLWCWAHGSHEGKTSIWRLGEAAKQLMPENAMLITDDGLGFPYKLMHIGCLGTTAGAQIYEVGRDSALQRKRTMLVSSTRPPKGFATSICGIVESHVLVEPQETWYLTLVFPNRR
jgi:hypothetical protein